MLGSIKIAIWSTYFLPGVNVDFRLADELFQLLRTVVSLKFVRLLVASVVAKVNLFFVGLAVAAAKLLIAKFLWNSSL